MTRARVLVVKRSNLAFDVRLQRIAVALSEKFQVTIAGIHSWDESKLEQTVIPDFNFAPLPLPLRVVRKVRREITFRLQKPDDFEGRFGRDRWISKMSAFIRSKNFDLIIACDIDAIAAACTANSNAILVGDMHEHAPTELANHPGWLEAVGVYKEWMCREFLPQTNANFTVSESLAESFAQNFSIPKPSVYRNVVPYFPRIKEFNGQAPQHFIHHGIAAKTRRLEEHASLANELRDPYSVSMMLQPVETIYYKTLNDFSNVIPNFHIVPPVKPGAIVESLVKYDAGLYLLKPETEQLRVTLPNKFFEFVQARLPVFSAGMPEVDALIRKYEIGLPLGSYHGREAAKVILENRDLDWPRIHKNLDEAAHDLSLENEIKVFKLKIEELLSI